MASARCSHCVFVTATDSACLGGCGTGNLGARPMGDTTLHITVATQPTPHSVNRSFDAALRTSAASFAQPCGGKCRFSRLFGPQVPYRRRFLFASTAKDATGLDEIEPRADRQTRRPGKQGNWINWIGWIDSRWFVSRDSRIVVIAIIGPNS